MLLICVWRFCFSTFWTDKVFVKFEANFKVTIFFLVVCVLEACWQCPWQPTDVAGKAGDVNIHNRIYETKLLISYILSKPRPL